MARRAFSIAPRWPGVLSGTLVLLLTLGTLAAVVARAEWNSGLSSADWAAVRFTISQAFVSALISVALAIPVARALARRQFPGRGVVITLLGAPFLLPVIVAVLGLLAIFGRSGVLNVALGWFGLPSFSVYGFHGVVLAHVFFNLPLATRLILQGWLAIPAERFRLAETLNASVWQLLEWPMLRSVVPGIFLTIFLICLTSFAVALTLGGGPKATTVELAIYQALRFDFDLGRAALLAGIQFALCVVAAVIAWRITQLDMLSGGMDRVVQRWRLPAPMWDMMVIGLAAAFLLLPLMMIVFRGLPGLFDMPMTVWNAALRSIVVASISALLCVVLAVSLGLWQSRLVAIVGVLPLAASGLVVGTGAFIVVYPFVNPAKLALVVTVLVNATLALPFALRAIAPAISDVQRNFGRLGSSLNMGTLAWLRIVVLPRIRRPLGFGAGLAAALSMGDLGVIALFAGETQETLPLAMYRLMGSYQMETAASAGLLLLLLSLVMFWICDRGGRANAGL